MSVGGRLSSEFWLVSPALVRLWAGAAGPLGTAAAPKGPGAASAAPLISALLTPSKVTQLAATKTVFCANLKGESRST